MQVRSWTKLVMTELVMTELVMTELVMTELVMTELMLAAECPACPSHAGAHRRHRPLPRPDGRGEHGAFETGAPSTAARGFAGRRAGRALARELRGGPPPLASRGHGRRVANGRPLARRAARRARRLDGRRAPCARGTARRRHQARDRHQGRRGRAPRARWRVVPLGALRRSLAQHASAHHGAVSIPHRCASSWPRGGRWTGTTRTRYGCT
jgi:hypothetical protein